MAVTLKEIAKRAGVHISTVDKVLHGRKGVSDAVRERVQKIIDETGYKPNPAGRTLQRLGKTYQIVVILVAVDAAPYILRGIQAWSKENGQFSIELQILEMPFDGAEKQEKMIRQAVADGADGIILFPKYSTVVKSAVKYATEENIPVITVNSDLEGSGRLRYIGHDGKRGAKLAGRMMGLMLSGVGRIGIVTSAIAEENSDYHVQKRETEFKRFLESNYPKINIVETVESFEDRQVTYEKTCDLLQRHPELSGIYITCGGASEVGRALKDLGRDLYVISFESYPEILKLLEEGVFDCTIGGDLEEQGNRSMQVLMDYLVYGTCPKEETLYTESRIILKESFS